MQTPVRKIKLIASLVLILGCTIDPVNSFGINENTTFDLGEIPQSTRIVNADISFSDEGSYISEQEATPSKNSCRFCSFGKDGTCEFVYGS